MQKIFELLEKKPDEQMTVDEFVQSYIFLEEKLKIKNIKLEKILDELSEEINRDKEALSKAEDEIELENGLTNKSNLYLSVIEAQNLVTESLIGECNPYCVISFQGEKQETLIKKNTNSPAWNENFKFKVKDKNGIINIEIFNKTLIGKKSMGYVNIDLNDLLDQEKKVKWYELFSDKIETGKIRLKLHCIINLKHYYQTEIEKIQQEIQILSNAHDILSYYVEQMNKNFGIIYTGNVDNLLNKQYFMQIDQLISVLEKQKENLFVRRSVGEPFNSNENTNDILFKNSKSSNNNIKSPISKILMIILILSTLFTLVERSDFLNLFIGVIILVLFVLDKDINIVKYLQPLILTIGASLIYDFFWFIIQFMSYLYGEDKDPEVNLKRIVYFLSAVNSGIKALLIASLNSFKRRKLINESDLSAQLNY